MLKKRLGAFVFVKNGIVVQSIGFKKYLPIGKPEVVLKNLDDWGSDEIILVDNDSSNTMQPNIKLIQKIADLKVRTPLVYGGGIKNAKDATQCIKNGADRILINQIFFEDINQISKISEVIGKESLILNINFSFSNNRLNIFNYKTRVINQINYKTLEIICKNHISEILLTDYLNEGKKNGFNFEILKNFFFKKKKILVYGGINSKNQFSRLFRYKNVSSVILGNCLNYKESYIFKIKKQCKYGFRK